MFEALPSFPQFLLLAGMGVIIWVLWRRSARRFSTQAIREKTPPRTSLLEKNRDLALSDAPPELTRWQVEMYDTARDLKGEIDTKLAVLQTLTRHANEAAERLERAIQRAEEASLPGGEHQAARHPQADLIEALADRGATAESIAAQTGLPLSDIELTLSLRKPR